MASNANDASTAPRSGRSYARVTAAPVLAPGQQEPTAPAAAGVAAEAAATGVAAPEATAGNLVRFCI